MGPHDPVTHRQSQARPLAHILRREKGVEDPDQMLWGNSDPCIGDLDLDEGMSLALSQTGRDRDPPTIRHGFHRVHQEIQEDLFKLVGIRQDGGVFVFRPNEEGNSAGGQFVLQQGQAPP